MNSATKPEARQDRATFASLRSVPGVDLFSASFVNHRFGAHSHDTWGLGACLRGGQDMAARPGTHRIIRAGQLGAIPPGEVHAGHPVGELGITYSMIYLPNAVLAEHAMHLGMKHEVFGMEPLSDARLARRLLSFVELGTRHRSSDLTLHSEWCALMDALLLRYGKTELRETRLPVKHPGLCRAISYIDAHWNQALSLETVANEAAMSSSYFCRQFTRAFGISPHRYQVVVRVARAKEMLARGSEIAAVATATGFADQSHLGRHLKSCLGVSPNELKRGLAGQ